MLRLNTKRLAADLMLTSGKHGIEEGVPFFAIIPEADKRTPQKAAAERGNPEHSSPDHTNPDRSSSDRRNPDRGNQRIQAKP